MLRIVFLWTLFYAGFFLYLLKFADSCKCIGRKWLTESINWKCWPYFFFVFIHVAMTLNVVYILLTSTFYMNYMNVAFWLGHWSYSGEKHSDFEHHHGASGPGLQPCTEFTVDVREELKSVSSYQREIQMLTDDQW